MIKILIKENKIPDINISLILSNINNFIDLKTIKGIYHYGSSYTGVYGKTYKDTYGDIDIAIVSSQPINEDDWFNSEEYELLKNENYDVVILSSENEIPGKFKKIK